MNCKKLKRRYKQLQQKLGRHALKAKKGKISKLTRELHDTLEYLVKNLCETNDVQHNLVEGVQGFDHTGQTSDTFPDDPQDGGPPPQGSDAPPPPDHGPPPPQGSDFGPGEGSDFGGGSLQGHDTAHPKKSEEKPTNHVKD